ncbi:caltractin-like [Anneissia japonica]|uniref:caltractin-like n=1 Tax=Anneissia japonica TaxID=1529436 RepID=UPI001425990A|nr:caltractin-like [Anneissia japonica]XP_033107836.1 caltractin-like [Anneissia japonica]
MAESSQEIRNFSETPQSSRIGSRVLSSNSSSSDAIRTATQAFLDLEREPKTNVTNSSIIRAQLTQQEIRDLRFVFDTFTSKDRRLIEANDLYRAMRVLGFKIKMRKIEDALIDMGRDGTRCINFEEFLELVVHYQGESRDIHEELMQGFTLIDRDKQGFITYNDIKRASQECGLNLNDRAIREMLQEADQTGNSRITAKEFMEIMLQTQLFQSLV